MRSSACQVDPRHNKGVFDDGQLNSGDLGYKDAEGRAYIVRVEMYTVQHSTRKADFVEKLSLDRSSIC